MRSFTLAAAALMCGTSALAQSSMTSDQPSNTQVHGQPTIQPNGSGAVAETEAPQAATQGVDTDATMTTGASATTGASTDMSATGTSSMTATTDSSQTGSMAANTTATTAAGETAVGPTTKVIAMGDHYTVQRVMPDGTVMVKTLTGEEAKMAMRGENPPALASFMASYPQMASTSYTSGAGSASMAMSAPTPEGTTMAGNAIASYDANKDGTLTPLEFAQHIIATSAPAAGGDATLSAEARRELRSRASGNGAVKLLNQTADELSMADKNRDFRIDQNELAMWHSAGMPSMGSAAMSPGASMTTGAGMSQSTDTTMSTGTSTPAADASVSSPSPDGAASSTNDTATTPPQ